tara:strand:- start:88437 stop:88628 length:192 start_codon:yes stop_codon:yes gene_type:complete
LMTLVASAVLRPLRSAINSPLDSRKTYRSVLLRSISPKVVTNPLSSNSLPSDNRQSAILRRSG